MSGQVSVTIGEKQWLASLATSYWEQVSGLGGVPSIDAGTGMLFDLGFEQTVQVTTEPMLFPLDIAFLSEELLISEVYRNVQPGLLVTSTIPASYFLEVNAGELEGIEDGSQASVELLASESPVQAPDWVTPMVSFTGFLLMGFLLVSFVRDSTGIESPKVTHLPAKRAEPSYCRESGGQTCAICERVSPSDYRLLSWVGSPLPDYSFSVEPATGERRIDEVLKRLKDGVDGIQQSDNFRQFLLTMAKFHDYSIGNLILIMLQKPDATRVAGFSTWKDLYRWVKKGEKGIAILAPCIPPKQKPEPSETGEERGKEKEEDIEVRPVYFKVVYVFDVSQTDGKPLPEIAVPVLSGEADEALFERVIRLTKAQELEVSFEFRPNQDPEIKGIFYGKGIWVRPEESRAQQLKTLIHEVAHYYSEGVFRIPRADAETIAESVAFTVGAHFGFDTGTRSFPYVALWSKDKKSLETNLSAIRKVSGKIIDALESVAANTAEVRS